MIVKLGCSAILIFRIQSLQGTEPSEQKVIVNNNEEYRNDPEMEKRKTLHSLHQLLHNKKIHYQQCVICKSALKQRSISIYFYQKKII